jgi:hypothetical protein
MEPQELEYPLVGQDAPSVYENSDERSINRDFLPYAARQAALNPVQIQTPSVATALNATGTLNSGFNITFFVRLSTKNKNRALIVMETNIFLGVTSDPAANLFPGGTSFNSSDFDLLGPIRTPFSLAGVADALQSTSSRFNLANTGVSNYTINVTYTWRMISNRGDIIV